MSRRVDLLSVIAAFIWIAAFAGTATWTPEEEFAATDLIWLPLLPVAAAFAAPVQAMFALLVWRVRGPQWLRVSYCLISFLSGVDHVHFARTADLTSTSTAALALPFRGFFFAAVLGLLAAGLYWIAKQRGETG